MNTRTYSITVSAPKSRVFAFLADIENLPQWATCFCKQMELVDGQHWVTTPDGKVLVDIRAHHATGTIDFLAGPSLEEMGRYPARVLDLPDGESLVLFTTLQFPGIGDEEFEAQGVDARIELDNVARILSPVHA